MSVHLGGYSLVVDSLYAPILILAAEKMKEPELTRQWHVEREALGERPITVLSL
jgi:hypothetical protein